MKTIEDYQAAINQFCRDNPETTIYLTGEISHPGISDLDFLVVDNVPFISKKVEPFLMGGNVLIVPEFALDRIQSIENLSLKIVQGQGSSKSKKPLSENEKIIQVLEWLPERILKCKNQLQVSENSSLLLHKSTNRSIDVVSELTGEKYETISSDEARCGKLCKKEILKRTTSQAEHAWKDFEYYVKNKISGTCSGTVSISSYYKFDNTFTSLMLYFDRMSGINCSFSKSLSKKISISSEDAFIEEELLLLMKERWELLNQMYMWFVDNNIKSGMIKYGWLLK